MASAACHAAAQYHLINGEGAAHSGLRTEKLVRAMQIGDRRLSMLQSAAGMGGARGLNPDQREWTLAFVMEKTGRADPRYPHGTTSSLSRTVDLLGVTVENIGRDEAIARLDAALRQKGLTRVAFLNAHGANIATRHAAFRHALSVSLVLPDGIGVDLGARLLKGAPFAANLNGTDFVPDLLASIMRRQNVVLLGAAPGVAERAIETLERIAPQHAYRVLYHGFEDAAARKNRLESLARNPADILLVALGNPAQEIFISDEVNETHARLAMGVGALFDFLAAEVPRAPKIMRRLRLEWLFRLMVEPRRLFRRYVVGIPVFLGRILHQAIRRK
jgi:exopolysaccharide biosynthesis WecB/TagA/CpsF family protein